MMLIYGVLAAGPKEETINDFWRMIWEQQSSIIVMVTRCEEGNRVRSCLKFLKSVTEKYPFFEKLLI